jgi:hypothetical protein
MSLALSAAAAPAAHAADWSAPFTVIADRSVAALSLAADARGGLVAVWQHDTGRSERPQDGGYGGSESYIRGRAIGPDGRPGVVQTLSITGELTRARRSPPTAAAGRSPSGPRRTEGTGSRSSPSRARPAGASDAGRPWGAPVASSPARRAWG